MCDLGARCAGGTTCVQATKNSGCESLDQGHCLGCGIGRFASSEPFRGGAVAEMLRTGDVYGVFLVAGFTVKQSLHPEIKVGAVIARVDSMPLNPAWLALNYFEQELPAEEQPARHEVTLYYPGEPAQTLVLAR